MITQFTNNLKKKKKNKNKVEAQAKGVWSAGGV